MTHQDRLIAVANRAEELHRFGNLRLHADEDRIGEIWLGNDYLSDDDEPIRDRVPMIPDCPCNWCQAAREVFAGETP